MGTTVTEDASIRIRREVHPFLHLEIVLKVDTKIFAEGPREEAADATSRCVGTGESGGSAETAALPRAEAMALIAGTQQSGQQNKGGVVVNTRYWYPNTSGRQSFSVSRNRTLPRKKNLRGGTISSLARKDAGFLSAFFSRNSSSRLAAAFSSSA